MQSRGEIRIRRGVRRCHGRSSQWWMTHGGHSNQRHQVLSRFLVPLDSGLGYWGRRGRRRDFHRESSRAWNRFRHIPQSTGSPPKSSSGPDLRVPTGSWKRTNSPVPLGHRGQSRIRAPRKQELQPPSWNAQGLHLHKVYPGESNSSPAPPPLAGNSRLPVALSGRHSSWQLTPPILAAIVGRQLKGSWSFAAACSHVKQLLKVRIRLRQVPASGVSVVRSRGA